MLICVNFQVSALSVRSAFPPNCNQIINMRRPNAFGTVHSETVVMVSAKAFHNQEADLLSVGPLSLRAPK